MNINEKLERLDHLYAEQKLPEAEKELKYWTWEAESFDRPGEQLTLYNELEGLYRVTGRAEEASGISQKALAIIEKMGLTGTVHHATTLLNAATAHRAAGHPEEALSLYTEAQQIYENLKEEPGILYYNAALSNNLAQVYQELGQYAEAELCLKKALAIVKNIPGLESEEATTHTNLSLLYSKMGRPSEAEEEVGQALFYYRTQEGTRDNHYSSACSAAGMIAAERGSLDEAEKYFSEALGFSEKVFGDTPETRIIRNNLEEVKERKKREK